MSARTNRGSGRWCYSLVESSMNDPVGVGGCSVLPVPVRRVGVEPAVVVLLMGSDTLLSFEESDPRAPLWGVRVLVVSR